MSWRVSRSGRSGLAFAGPHIVGGPGATKDKAQATAADWSARPTVCVFVFTGSGARSTLVIDHGPLASASVVLVIIQSSGDLERSQRSGFQQELSLRAAGPQFRGQPSLSFRDQVYDRAKWSSSRDRAAKFKYSSYSRLG